MTPYLPANWKMARLTDVGKVVTGTTPAKSHSEYYDGPVPFVTPSELDASGPIRRTQTTLTQLGASKAKLLPAGSVLVSCIGSLGKVGFADVELTTNQQINAVVPDAGQIDPRYLYQYCRTLKHVLEHIAPSTTLKIVKKSLFQELPIPLPPLPEQRRIAAILDKADAVRRKRQQTLDLADQFLRSAFLDLFGDPVTNPKRWPIVAIEDLAEPSKGSIVIGPFGSDLKVSDYHAEGHPVIFVRDVLEGQFMWKSNIYVDDEKFVQLGSHRVLAGDVVATKMGTPPAIAAVYPSQMPEGVVTADIVRIRPDLSKAYPAYLAGAINAPFIKAQVRRITEGVTRPKITLGRFKELRIPHPPLEVQESWDKLVVMRRTNAEHAALVSARCDDLFGALVQHAFRGEL